MRYDKDYDFFVTNFDWYKKDEAGFYVPTDKAPPEAIEAISRVNKRIEWEQKQNANY